MAFSVKNGKFSVKMDISRNPTHPADVPGVQCFINEKLCGEASKSYKSTVISLQFPKVRDFFSVGP